MHRIALNGPTTVLKRGGERERTRILNFMLEKVPKPYALWRMGTISQRHGPTCTTISCRCNDAGAGSGGADRHQRRPTAVYQLDKGQLPFAAKFVPSVKNRPQNGAGCGNPSVPTGIRRVLLQRYAVCEDGDEVALKQDDGAEHFSGVTGCQCTAKVYAVAQFISLSSRS